jgi:hypothetical protein
MESEADVVIIADPHMTFPKGWIKKITNHIKKQPDGLVCTQVRHIGKDFLPEDEKIYTGAFIGYKKQVNLVPGIDYHALMVTWNDFETKPGPVGAVLGACYGMRREWYETIGNPLSVLDEWGMDEEILSIGTHLMGGSVVCLPVVCGHLFGAPNQERMDSDENKARRIVSRYAMLECIPMSCEERTDLQKWIEKKASHKYGHLEAGREMACMGINHLWAGGKRTWQDLKKAGIVRPLTEQECKIAMRFRTQEHPAGNGEPQGIVHVPQYRESSVPRPPVAGSACERCDAVVRWEVLNGFAGMKRCPHCNHKQRIGT